MDWDDDGLYKEWARLINNEWDNMCRMLDEALQAGTVGNIYNGKNDVNWWHADYRRANQHKSKTHRPPLDEDTLSELSRAAAIERQNPGMLVKLLSPNQLKTLQVIL